MEHLFTANLPVGQEHLSYEVIFENEQYVFSTDKEVEFPRFSFKREHDEWVDQQSLPAELKKKAVDALEKYLLAQH